MLTAVLGLTASAQARVSERFDALASTEIRVQPLPGTKGETFGLDADVRAGSIEGVTASGVTWPVRDSEGLAVSALPQGVDGPGNTAQIVVSAATPGLFGEAGASLHVGRAYDWFAEARGARVAVVGIGAARQLGIASIVPGITIRIEGMNFVVVGVLADTRRHPEMLSRIMIPSAAARTYWPGYDPGDAATMYVQTAVGATAVVGAQLTAALRPDAPDLFNVVLPADPRGLRSQLDADLGALFAVLAGVCLIVGVFGIANTTLASVLERRAEIGLRRALGARPGHIALQFILESAILGAFGGLVGTSLGTVSVVLVCILRDWTAVLPPLVALVGPLVGLVAGLAAGLYPALRAARWEPVEALRS